MLVVDNANFNWGGAGVRILSIPSPLLGGESPLATKQVALLSMIYMLYSKNSVFSWLFSSSSSKKFPKLIEAC